VVFAVGCNIHRLLIGDLTRCIMPTAPNPDLLSVVTEEFGFERGHPLPLGATVARGGINFAIVARHATAVTLVLFLPGNEAEIAAFPLGACPGIDAVARESCFAPKGHNKVHFFGDLRRIVTLNSTKMSGKMGQKSFSTVGALFSDRLLDPRRNRTGDVWHAFLAGLDPGIEYAYRIGGPGSDRHRFDHRLLLADPYEKGDGGN